MYGFLYLYRIVQFSVRQVFLLFPQYFILYRKFPPVYCLMLFYINRGTDYLPFAYKALIRIGTIYDLEGALKDLAPEEHLKERQASI